MKNIKKIFLAALLLLPVNVFAAGSMIGTGLVSDGLGLTNIYYQHKLGSSSAVVVGYETISGSYGGGTITATMYSAAYKGYFSNYADGGYWKLGAVAADVTASAGGSSLAAGSVTLPILVVGYETTMGSNFVMGAEAGLAAGQGLGIFDINVAYMF